MKISCFLLSAASVTADLFVPMEGEDLMIKTFAEAVITCKHTFGGSLANPEEYSRQQVIIIIYFNLYN